LSRQGRETLQRFGAVPGRTATADVESAAAVVVFFRQLKLAMRKTKIEKLSFNFTRFI
jgi:hypothetical protein